jgi:hypothetical protein
MTGAALVGRGVMARLARADAVRAPILAGARPDGYKEWFHFVVHHPGGRLLVNLSLTAEVPAAGPYRLVPRVIVINHGDRWTGVVERLPPEAVDVSADLATLSLAGNRMSIGPDGYHVRVELPERDVRAELRLVPHGSRFVMATNQPAGTGRMSWLFVPRLKAYGWVRTDRREHRLEAAVAYHDHNWGRFRWGDDFGWEWGSILPAADEPWSVVFMRMTDRPRLRSLSQALYLWRDEQPPLMFRDVSLSVRTEGLLGRAPDCTLPPPMRLVLGGDSGDVPAALDITATHRGDSLRLRFEPTSWARLGYPNELHLDRSVVLCETTGPARVSGLIDGRELAAEGAGVVEVFRA